MLNCAVTGCKNPATGDSEAMCQLHERPAGKLIIKMTSRTEGKVHVCMHNEHLGCLCYKYLVYESSHDYSTSHLKAFKFSKDDIGWFRKMFGKKTFEAAINEATDHMIRAESDLLHDSYDEELTSLANNMANAVRQNK